MSKPRGRYRCAPGGEFTMLIGTEARKGERIHVKFGGLADEDGEPLLLHMQGAEECTPGFGPHSIRIRLPDEAPEGEYMLRALALMRGDETTAIFPPDQLMNVWLFVVGPIEGPVPEATILRLTRPE